MTKSAIIERATSKAEPEQARRALEALRQGKPLVGEAAAPPAAAAAIECVLQAMAEGGGAAIVPFDAQLTTQEAANLLGVSHSTLIRRLEDGTLPFRTLGSPPRINAAKVVAYLEHEREERRASLDEMVAMNQRDEMVAMNQRAGFYD